MFQVVSDLHLEDWLPDREGDLQAIKGILSEYYPEIQGGGLLIINGDISTNVEDIRVVLEYVHGEYEQVVYVLGNAEYSLKPLKGGDRYANLEEKVNQIENIVDRLPNVRILEGSVFEYEGQVFYGASGGLDPENVKRVTGLEMEDYFENSLDKWKERMGVDWEAEDFVKFFEERYENVKNVPEHVDVMVTHYIPRYREGLFLEEKENCYMSKPEVRGITQWVFGHVHGKTEDVYEGVQYWNRSLGRRSENVIKEG